jgi:hypothetical protein
MKAPAIVAVELPSSCWTELIREAKQRGARVGWLEWNGADLELPVELEGVMAGGCERVVLVGPRRTVSFRVRRGPSVLRDVIRSHFLGWDLVLVHGLCGIPRLELRGDKFWLVGGVEERVFPTAAALAAELLRPRWRLDLKE